MSRIPLVIATIMLMTVLAPSAASDDGKKHIVLLPLGPDLDRFFFSMPTENQESTCGKDVNIARGDSTSSAWTLYGTSNVADPCRATLAELDAQRNGNAHAGSLLVAQGTVHTLHIIPTSEELVLDTTAKIAGKLWIEAGGVSAFRPTVIVHNVTTTSVGTEYVGEVGRWTAPALDEPIVANDPSAKYQNRHAFEFEVTAPEKIVGKIRVSIDLRRTAEAEGVRAISAPFYRLGVHEAAQSYIDIPIASVSGQEEPELFTCDDGTEVNNSTECPDANETTGSGNETVDPDQPDQVDNNTTAAPSADNNTTAKPKDKGIPGFGLVTVVSAGFMAALVLRRRRQ